MRELWRKTVELFRGHLVLWVPCVCAGLLNLGFARLQKAAIFRIVHWLTTQHSVLGGDVVSTDPSEFQHRALMIAGPLGLCRYFLCVCFFVVALAVTAKLVETILEEKKPELSVALRGTVPEWREILLFSLKYLAALAALSAVMLLSTSSALISYRLSVIVASKAFLYSVGLVLEGGVAWLLMPAAMRLLQSPDVTPVSVQCRRRGTVFVVFMSALALALGDIVGMAEARVMLDNQWELSAVSALNSIVVNAPEVFLFISLSLLASGYSREADSSKSSRASLLLLERGKPSLRG